MPDFKAPQVVPVNSDSASDSTSVTSNVTTSNPSTPSDLARDNASKLTPASPQFPPTNDDTSQTGEMDWDLPSEPTQPYNPPSGPAMGNPAQQFPAGNQAFGGGGGWGAAMGGNNGWGDPWGGGAGAGQGSMPKRLTPQERVEMIERVYGQVLDRKPDTRDINYYKYSTLGEEEIRKQLIDGKEHKQLMEDGRNYKKMEERTDQAEARVRMLEGQIKDQIEEFKHLTELLDEKNKFIQRLRGEKDVQYGFKTPGTISPNAQSYNTASTIPYASGHPPVTSQYVAQEPQPVVDQPPAAVTEAPMQATPEVSTPTAPQPQYPQPVETLPAQPSAPPAQQFSAPGSVELPSSGFEAIEEKQGQMPIAHDNSPVAEQETPSSKWADNNPPNSPIKNFLDKFVSIISPDQ